MPDIDIGDYEVDEDSNGDLVIRDTNDNIVFRWDDTNGTWTFDNNPIEGVTDFTAESVSAEEADITHPDVANPSFPARSAFNVQGGTDAEAGLTLVGSDNNDNRAGKAPVWWYDATGEIPLFNMVAHRGDHDHFSCYAWHGDDGIQRNKVFNLDFNRGDGQNIARWVGLEKWHLQSQVGYAEIGDLGEPGVRVDMKADETGGNIIRFQNELADDSVTSITTGLNPNQTGADIPAYVVTDNDSPGAGHFFACIPELGETRVYKDINNFAKLRSEIGVGSQPAAGDLEAREIGFTPDRDGAGTPAWLYNDGNNVHYWDSDGTL